LPVSFLSERFYDLPVMPAAIVLEVLEALSINGCEAWVLGGWGVDALVGRETRPHRDLDLAIDADKEAVAMTALAGLGFVVETDWRPVRVELRAPSSRFVDLHPVAFDRDGNGRQAGLNGGFYEYPRGCFTTGHVAGLPVACATVALQLTSHAGYEPRDIDRHDLDLLRNLPG
jgi:lincosamide nucleotidyltransferase A/C/D/E